MHFRRTVGVLLVAMLAAFALAACGGDSSSDATPTSGAPITAGGGDRFRAGVVSPPFQKPNVVLTDTSGSPYDLKAETDGFVTLLFFGYTHCPDICPMAMANASSALSQLPGDEADRVKVVFITADPARDTPDVLRDWLDHFGEDFVGLTGTEDEINAVLDHFGFPHPEKTPVGDGDGYAVSHTAFAMAFIGDIAPLIFPDGMDSAIWAHDIHKLLTEGWNES